MEALAPYNTALWQPRAKERSTSRVHVVLSCREQSRLILSGTKKLRGMNVNLKGLRGHRVKVSATSTRHRNPSFVAATGCKSQGVSLAVPGPMVCLRFYLQLQKSSEHVRAGQAHTERQLCRQHSFSNKPRLRRTLVLLSAKSDQACKSS